MTAFLLFMASVVTVAHECSTQNKNLEHRNKTWSRKKIATEKKTWRNKTWYRNMHLTCTRHHRTRTLSLEILWCVDARKVQILSQV